MSYERFSRQSFRDTITEDIKAMNIMLELRIQAKKVTIKDSGYILSCFLRNQPAIIVVEVTVTLPELT